MIDQQATAASIREGIIALLEKTHAGDSVFIQFSGHGTQVPDDNGDEVDTDRVGRDEALVPYDYMTGGLVIDDDLGLIFSRTRPGVSVTVMMDCCHSGTNTRLFLRAGELLSGQRARYLRPTPGLIAANRAARSRSLGVTSTGQDSYSGAREVLVAACRSDEVAYETNGSGDFSRFAIMSLRQSPTMTMQQFADQMTQQFNAAGGRQTPGLYCNPTMRNRQVFAAMASGESGQ